MKIYRFSILNENVEMNKQLRNIILLIAGIFAIAIISSALDVGDTSTCTNGSVLQVNNSIWSCMTLSYNISTGNGTLMNATCPTGEYVNGTINNGTILCGTPAGGTANLSGVAYMNFTNRGNFTVNGVSAFNGDTYINHTLILGNDVTSDWNISEENGNLVITNTDTNENISMPTMHKTCIGSTSTTFCTAQTKLLYYTDFTPTVNSSYNPLYNFVSYHRGNGDTLQYYWPKGTQFVSYYYANGTINFPAGVTFYSLISPVAGTATYASGGALQGRLDVGQDKNVTLTNMGAVDAQVNLYQRTNTTVGGGSLFAVGLYTFKANQNGGNSTLRSGSSTSTVGILTTQAQVDFLNASTFTGWVGSIIARAPTGRNETDINKWAQLYMEKNTIANENYQIYSVGGDNYFGNGTHVLNGSVAINKSTPTHALDVSGQISSSLGYRFGTAGTLAGWLYPYSSSTYTTLDPAGKAIAFFSYDNDNSGSSISYTGNTITANSHTNFQVMRYFMPAANGTGTYRNLYIGTTINQNTPVQYTGTLDSLTLYLNNLGAINLTEINAIHVLSPSTATNLSSSYNAIHTDYGHILIQNGTVEITNLSGTGNAYACLDSNGVLYRSNVTCV